MPGNIPLLRGAAAGDDFSVTILIALGVMSLAIGAVGGVVGIALGVIRLPAMIALGVDPLVAAGTNLLVSVVSSTAASWPALVQKRVVPRVVIVLGVPAMIGSLIGGLYADSAPIWLLLATVSAFLLWSSISLITRSVAILRHGAVSGYADANGGRGEMTTKTVVREGALGMVIGLVGGAVGLALGVLRMPVLVHILKMDPALAAGTNLVITVFVGLAGFTGHLIEGRVDWTLVLVVGGTATVGMYFGSLVTGKFDPVKLRLAVGLVLLIVAPFVLFDALTR